MNNKTHRNITNRLGLTAGIVAMGLLGAACTGSATEESADPAATSAAAAAATTAASGAGEAPAGPASSGSITIDGSSTVAPLVTLAAEDFMAANEGVEITVGTSGTGGGFEKFCAGETDISNASRAIKDTEAKACADKGIEFIEIVVANDALSVVTNPDNDWATCLTVEQLKKMWEPAAEGKVTNWNQVDPAFADEKLDLFGPGTDSGTFDYFTKAINGEEGASRTDYSPSENDNNTITGVTGSKGALGYFGFSYLEENLDKVKPVAVDSGKGCVEPSVATVQDGTYTPLSRTLFMYISKAAAARGEVKAFVDYYAAEQDALTAEALFVPLDDAQKATQATEIASIG